MKIESLEYKTVEEFLADLKKFREENDEIIKVTELKRIEQEGNRMIEEFVQKFREAARKSGYEERLLVEEFKRGMNGMIRRKFIEIEKPFKSIKQ